MIINWIKFFKIMIKIHSRYVDFFWKGLTTAIFMDEGKVPDRSDIFTMLRTSVAWSEGYDYHHHT